MQMSLSWQIRGSCWIRFKIETNLAVQCFRRYTKASSVSNQAPFSLLGEDDSAKGFLLVALDLGYESSGGHLPSWQHTFELISV